MKAFLCIPCVTECDAVVVAEEQSNFIECYHCERLDHCLLVQGKLLGSEAEKIRMKLENDFLNIFS